MTEEKKMEQIVDQDGEVVDFTDVKAGVAALDKKKVIIDAQKAEIRDLRKQIYQKDERITDLEQNLEQALEGKNRYQREFMRANKINVEAQNKERSPSDGFVDDLVGRIKRMKTAPWVVKSSAIKNRVFGIIKHSEIMVERNIYLTKLENRMVQDEVFDLLR
ncbi:17079_t:CDS:2, partial [Racocetra persica]